MAVSIRATLSKLFSRRRKAPLVCTMHFDDPSHVHGPSCYLETAPLSILELFQSQSCAATVPSVPHIHSLITTSPNALLLTYNVTYWDHVGWVDTFGQKTWDARQRAYNKKWARSGVFTPQIIVDGIADGNGSTAENVRDTVARAVAEREKLESGAVAMEVDDGGNRVKIVSDRDGGEIGEACDVLLVEYDKGPVAETVKIKGGPNKGKKLPHLNVVVTLSKIGEWKGEGRRVWMCRFQGTIIFKGRCLCSRGWGVPFWRL